MDGDQKETKECIKNDRKQHMEEERCLGGPRFCPPLYIQRYGFVRKILDQHKIKSVVDFGCAECKILTLMKAVESLETISLVDINENLLRSCQNVIRPKLDEFLHRRSNPLRIQLLAGSAAMLDGRLIDVEAVTLIEIIEHLTDDVLEGVTVNIFQNIHPLLIIVTTPNSDFNVLFPGFEGFRHWDHKFEWSRCQFETWCNEICKKYGYKVDITGIGDPPDDFHSVGYCSQVAIFTVALTTPSEKKQKSLQLCYKMISEIDYPYKEKKLTVEEELDIEVKYYVRQQCLQALKDQAEDSIVISADELLKIKKVGTLFSPNQIRDYLERNYNLTENACNITVDLKQFICVDDDDDDNDFDDEVNADVEGICEQEEDDWD
ncbi:small RNA 2'-O-methyltransferase isoform X1 [Patella vulgata]|uniref:small RNA 2'-O-methyltransferase isoform X1 n=1 Tax=Patella vulgata TaxID=6465 RepID=UPI00218098D9|nr:small RNA 2'-O-methyltransferase isoform X1 [Patella vulgata]